MEIARGDAALDLTTAAIRDGRIVAVKGLGGFHLLVDASSAAAVRRLRIRKHREEKPFALLCAHLADARRLCHVSPVEARLLTSAESPIVLLARRDALEADVAAAVAPGNPSLGIMLPYTPLHLLLTEGVGRPVVATSGNVSDEPICTDEREALGRLGGVADLFLVHDRPIVRHVDDSVVRVMLGRELVLRRARGYAPLPIPLRDAGLPAIAVGGHMKNTVAVTAGSDAFLSQHIGDLESQPSTEAFLAVVTSLQTLFDVRPAFVAADSHPDYLSTRYAAALGLPVIHVQHHHAHVAACAAENELDGPVLGVAWDGTGYGRDGTIWGGEFLRTHHAGFSRTACLRPFRLPGGERAVRQPRRTALGLLYAMVGTAVTATPGAPLGTFGPDERTVLVQMLERGLNAPVTSSTGRLFDGVAALLGLCERSTFEGQAAMALEHAADPTVRGGYPFAIDDRPARFAPRDGAWEVPDLVVDWAPMVHAILRDLRAATPSGTIAARFHDTLADMIVAVAVRVGEPRVVLTGGCFQNRLLTERAVHGLRDAGFSPYWHQRVPPNDGGLALGQIAASRRIATATRVGRTELAGARAGASA